MKEKIGVVLIVLLFLLYGYATFFIEDEEPVSDFDLGYRAAQEELRDWFDASDDYYIEIWAAGYDEGYSDGFDDGLSFFR